MPNLNTVATVLGAVSSAIAIISSCIAVYMFLQTRRLGIKSAAKSRASTIRLIVLASGVLVILTVASDISVLPIEVLPFIIGVEGALAGAVAAGTTSDIFRNRQTINLTRS